MLESILDFFRRGGLDVVSVGSIGTEDEVEDVDSDGIEAGVGSIDAENPKVCPLVVEG